jgi:hypothetical protein
MFTLARELDLFPACLVTLNTMDNGKQLSFTLFYCLNSKEVMLKIL